MKSKVKRIVAGVLVAVMVVTLIPSLFVSAESTQDVECVLFAQGLGDTINIAAPYITTNGDIIANGTISISGNQSINGNIYEQQEQPLLDYHSVIEELYYNDNDNLNYIESNYISDNYNENINNPVFVQGSFYSGYNVSINDTSLMTIDDIIVLGETFNADEVILYSQLGDITINTSNFSATGLIYAPFGDVTIEAQNINFKGMIIAQNIQICAEYNVNLNYDPSLIEKIGDGVMDHSIPDEDEDVIDIGEAYFKELSSENDSIYVGKGIYCVRNQVLLTTDDTVDFDEVSSLVADYGAEIVGYIELTGDYQIEFCNDIEVDKIKEYINCFLEYAFIENATLNLIIEDSCDFKSSDEKWYSDWNEDSPSGRDWGIESIKLESALISLGAIADSLSSSSDVDTSRLYNIKIGLIDDAFDEWHEDLDFTVAWNNYDDLSDLQASEKDHGSHVAGIMGAGFNNDCGIAGVCVKNRLYGFAIEANADETIREQSSLFKMKYALALLIGNNVKVINYSRGNGTIAFSAAQGNENAINAYNGITAEYEKFISKLVDKGYDFLIVASAGNANNEKFYYDPELVYGYITIEEYEKHEKEYSFVDTTVTYGAEMSGADIILNDADAKYNSAFLNSDYKIRSRVVCVGAVSKPKIYVDPIEYSLTAFSSTGERVDILAPGQDIYSCVITGAGDYDEKSGTSMAAPYVSGTIGLAYSINPTVEASRLKSILINNGSDVGLEQPLVNASETVSDVYKVSNLLTMFGLGYSSNQYNGIGTGFVVDENGKGLEGVKITATRIDDMGVTIGANIETEITDGNGYYAVILPAGKYLLQFEKTSYLGETIYFEAVEETTVYLETVTLFAQSWYDSILQPTVSGRITNALNGNGVEGAWVKFRKGWNNKIGEYVSGFWGVKSAVTDSFGQYSITLPVGAYTAEIYKEGYIIAYANIISSPNAGVQYIVITPLLDDNEFRIVLTWGDTPRDLDSHLTGTVNGSTYHIYYGCKTYYCNGVTIANLDYDDTSSYGPETITMTLTEDSKDCLYYVQDFTNRSNSSSMALSYSSAKVTVYQGNKLLVTYSVPVGIQGTTWDVFEIKDGILYIINTIK